VNIVGKAPKNLFSVGSGFQPSAT